MVLLGRAVICSSHKLSIQTIVVSGTVWPQFAMQLLTRGCQPKFGEKVDAGPKTGSLGSPVVTSSYRRPIVTIGLSFTVFAVLRLVMDRRTDGQTAKVGDFIGRQTLVICTEIHHRFILLLQRSIANVHRNKEGATIGLCWSEFFCIVQVPFNTNTSFAAAVAGEAIPTTLTLSPHTFHPRRCCCCLSAVSHNASV